MCYLYILNMSLIYTGIFIYIYPKQTVFDNSQNGQQLSHGDYKNTASWVEYRMQWKYIF